jgi:murein L,D-transpeptidase YcbB/YkuD
MQMAPFRADRFRPLAFLLLSAALASAAPQVSPEACPNVICRIVTYGRSDDLRWPDFADYRSRLTAFYARSYSPAWLENNKPTAKALAMIALLKAADLRGLKPEDYDAGLWEGRIAHLERSEFDVSLTVCVMRFLADLHFGKANPGFFHLDPKVLDFDIPVFLRTKLMESDDPNALITAEVEPPFEGYKRGEKTLRDYLVKARESEAKLSDGAATIEPGRPYSELQPLAQRLRQLGDLPDSGVPLENSKAYRGTLVEAVKHFQSRHGLDPDGRIGKATIEQLNVPLTQRVLQLRLTLERWRWIPHSFSQPPIVVNIPEFTLRALNSAYETELEMRVVVGSAYENETPVFAADLTHVTFRPYWNVPRSILENEMEPELAEDRSYLATHRYQLLNAADRVVPTSSGLTDAMLLGLRTGRYRIRQMPGPDNALGLIRFGLPNAHNVYLHATPSGALFAKSRRDFSHGCVRVEHPVPLAEWCLRETDGWNRAKILTAMHGSKTFQVDLKKPIPVLLVYATAIALRNGEVHFASDIYHQDLLLENRLAEGYPSRTTLDR